MTGPSQPGSGPTQPGQTSLLDQFQRTRESFMALLGAHIDLLKAELNDILGEVKVLATQGGILLGVALMTAVLLWVGGFLFLGEWLFGSIGWGLAHGLLFGIALIVALALAIVGSKPRYSVLSFVVALVFAVIVALLCGINVAYDAAVSVGTSIGGGALGAPGVVALIAGAIVFALLFGILFAFTMGARGAIVGVILGLIVGALAGWLIAGAPWTWPPAVGFAITLGLIAWPVLNIIFAFPSLDPAARFARLKPQQSMEAANETREWLEEQWQTRLPMRGSK
jgi:hypothetical protein